MKYNSLCSESVVLVLRNLSCQIQDTLVQEHMATGVATNSGGDNDNDTENVPKIKAIQLWEQPQSVRGVRGFLGFAKYYREFISKLSWC
jgi:hypothetical protein